jgi:HK97 family phage prohead protease
LKKTFILSDETVNQYGFIVATAGIKLDRFKNNPVMLYNHNDKEVIGRWENLRVEDGKLKADAVFDGDDELAQKIQKKVENDFIKGASVWVDWDVEDVKLNADGVPVVTASELMEGSIVSIPNNKNSVRLSASGVMIEDKSLALKLSSNNTKTEINTMKKVLLFAQILGTTLSAEATEDHVLEAVKNKVTELEAVKKELNDIKVKLAAEHDAKVVALIDGAITSKKLTAEKKDQFLKLAKLDYDSTKSIIDGMTEHQTLHEKLSATGGGEKNENKGAFDGKTFKEIMALPGGGNYLLKLKAENKGDHKKLWEASYPNGTYNG